MEENDDNNHINTNKEKAIDKKFIRQLLYNNIIKSSKKLKTNLSMIPTKFNKKPKNEMSLNNIKKTIKEKIPISSENKIVRKKINKNTKKSKIDIISNNNSNSKANVNKTYQNNLSIQHNNNTITNKKKLIPSKMSKIRIHAKSLSMSNIPLIDNNSYINSTSSHEKSPSELRTPKTISEDSFNIEKQKEKNSKENIKMNIKPEDVFKLLNLNKKNGTKKLLKQQLINNSHNMKSSKNINIKLRINDQNFIGFIPSIQKSIIVKKNQILNSNDKNKSKYEEKTEPIHQLKKNLSHHSIKFYLNKKFENKKGIKKNKNKIPINNKYKKIFQKNDDKDNTKDIIRTENVYKNEIRKSRKIFFKLDKKLSKDYDIDNTSINNKIKLIKYNKNINLSFKKYQNNNINLTLNLDNSNNLTNNSKELLNNNSIIYAPKKIKSRLRLRLKSHEKTSININNNISYDSEKIDNNFKKINDNKEKENYEMISLQDRNNSFCLGEDKLKLKQIFIKNDNKDLNTPRMHLNKENNNHKIRNNIINYFKYNSEQVMNKNDNEYIQNRVTINGERNTINLNTDFNNYNMNNLNNIFNNRISILPQGYNLSIFSLFKNNINQTNLINLYNNNYLNFNTIQGRAPFINNTSFNLCSNNTYQCTNDTKNSTSINIEDLIMLQEKLKCIIISLNKINTMENECFEFLNFYYNSSIYCQLEKSFINPLEANSVRISINFILFSIIICYDYSFEINLMNKTHKTLLNVVKLNYKNLIIIYEHIMSKISIESKNNIWVQKLSNIINSYKKIEYLKINNLSKIGTLNYNTNIIFQNLLLILQNFKTFRNEYILNFFNNIIYKSYTDINLFFREFILRINNLNGSILASVYLKSGKNKNFIPIPNPYIRTKNNKNFSLVLDLDETLVHFKEKLSNEGNGILRIRPGIPEFFEKVGKYYELIIFTTATQDYADILIDAIEADKIYFEHRFYRNHAIIINNDFVKDLTRIGRPLDKIIIIDNMPQNFRLQKENGIMINPFWGEDIYDTALFDLIPILINIAKEGGDVRKGLIKYKDDIFKKVSSTLSKEIL